MDSLGMDQTTPKLIHTKTIATVEASPEIGDASAPELPQDSHALAGKLRLVGDGAKQTEGEALCGGGGALALLYVGAEIWVGRGEACGIKLQHPRVSSRHLKIVGVAPGEVHVEDYSTNGSMLNGQRLVKFGKGGGAAGEVPAPTALRGGDEIDIAGELTLIFQPPLASTTVHLALVGCGMIADRHAAALRVVNAEATRVGRPGERITVVAAVDPQPAAAQRLARHFADHAARPFATLEDAMTALGDGIDAVLLMVPPSLNRVLVPLALRAGKHTYVQKPISPTPETTAQLLVEVDKLAGPDRPLLLISEHGQWQPEVLLVKEMLEAGAVGEVLTARAHFYGGTGGFEAGTWRSDIEGGGGIVVDGGTHYTRPLRLWLGEVAEVCGVTGRIFPDAVGETFARCLLRHTSGVVSTLDATASATPFSPQPFFTITGSTGEITIAPNPDASVAIDLRARLQAAAGLDDPSGLPAAVLAHVDALVEAAWLRAGPVNPNRVTHYSLETPAGKPCPLPGGKGGSFEAFIAEMAAFVTGVEDATGGGDGSAALPSPAFSAGEVEIAHALYRSAKSGKFEKVGGHVNAESGDAHLRRLRVQRQQLVGESPSPPNIEPEAQ
eukprot:SAG11_NODE_1455_length_4878_cov_3.119063_4_plen_612_part_00